MKSLSVSRRVVVLFILSSLLVSANAVAATITVNDPNDNHHTAAGQCAVTGTGTCGLFDAITYANTHSPRTHTINFSIGFTVVLVQAGLPHIQVPVTINGGGSPRMTLQGGPGIAGLVIDTMVGPPFNATTPGTGTTIENLIIIDFSGDGVAITDGGNLVQNCWIGIDGSGTAHPNSGNGVSI